MSDFDVIVIGGGTGNNVAAAAAEAGRETALVDPGPLGGTCLNRGCNPSKMLIQRANVANTVREADRFGIPASIDAIDFGGFVDDVQSTLANVAENMEDRYREMDRLTLFKSEARFIDERTIDVDGTEISGEKVLIAAGSRPRVPPIDGLEDVPYLTSDDALYLDELPERLVILGGGYISVELGYFFESMGTDVAIIDKNDILVSREDRDVAEAFTEIAARRHDVHTGYRVTAVSEDGGEFTVRGESETGDGDEIRVHGDAVLVALGRRPNSDTLDLPAAGVETNGRGFIETNEYLETTAENVWAQGDIAGNFLFKHAGDFETRHAIENIVHDARETVDFSATPHAIFAEPQIGGVGATELKLRQEGREYVVGTAQYADSAMARAKKLDEGFVKVLASPDGDILGCHVIGYEASTLIHEAVVAMRNGVSVADVADTIHAHPTVSKVMEAAFRDVPR